MNNEKDYDSMNEMKRVYVVHCVDTEGPLNESLEATFQRIEAVAGIRIQPSMENLEKIQKRELDLGGYEDMLANAFSERIMAYNRDWSELDAMLDRITSQSFRKDHQDSNGEGWKYSWFVMDHMNYDDNPRSKVTGFNAVWDHYKEYYRLHGIEEDEFQWHAHPANIYNAGNHCGVSYWNSPHILQSLCHRLIDRGFFPNGFRAGYHTERPDSHWFLEQYIPYDFSNQAVELTEEEKKQLDLSGGRFGDWRRAKTEWGYYHPSHDDYQIEGNCHRSIFRCLNVGTRLRLITQAEIDKAFEQANCGKSVLMAFCDHDFREMRYDIDEVYNMICSSAKRYPDVKWTNTTATEAAKNVIGEKVEAIKMKIDLQNQADGRVRIDIRTDMDSFGAQPFFAIKIRGGRYLAEQLDVQIPNRHWSYVFDEETVRAIDVESVGIATNSRRGSGALKVVEMNGNVLFDKEW